MRILFVLPDLPQPPFTGAHTRPLSLLAAAVQAHDVVVVGSAPSGADLGALRDLCGDVRAVPADLARPARRRALAAGRRLLSPVPLVGRGRSAAVAALVAATVTDSAPQAMLVETLYGAHYRVPDVPMIVDLSDVPSELCASAAAARPLRYAAAGLQAISSRRAERALLAGTIPVTINDADRQRILALGVASYVIPLAVQLPAQHDIDLRELASRDGQPLRLLFVGSFVHPPNREAARFLLRDLVPALRADGTAFTLTLAGRYAPEWARRAAGRDVRVFSDVADLAPLYRDADAVLVPLPHGGGTKNKTLEAMAWGLPVVGTPQAFTGLPSLDGQAFLGCAYDAADVVGRIRSLAGDPALRLRIGRAARAHVAVEHSAGLAQGRAASLFDAVAAGGTVADAEALWAARHGGGAPR